MTGPCSAGPRRTCVSFSSRSGEPNLLQPGAAGELPAGFSWLNEPPHWTLDGKGLSITPDAPTDFFRPYRGDPRDNCCLLYRLVKGDFTAVAHALAHLVDFGDAAALTVRSGPQQWAKLCLERSPVGDVSLVSVVTDPWSDDANSELLATPESLLRITRKGNVFGMHYSSDGSRWRFVRTFGLEMPDEVMVGIHAQAPFSSGCRVTFRSFSISPKPVGDFRSGE